MQSSTSRKASPSGMVFRSHILRPDRFFVIINCNLSVSLHASWIRLLEILFLIEVIEIGIGIGIRVECLTQDSCLY